MFKKQLFRIVLFSWLFLIGSHTCFAYDVQKVAILPVLYSHDISINKDVEKIITNALVRKFHMPLSKIITFFEIIPEADVLAALPVQLQEKKKSKIDNNLLADVGGKLNADIVIAVEIKAYRSDLRMSWNGDRIRDTDLVMKIISYHRPSGKYTEEQDHEFYSGADIPWGQPEYIADHMIDRLLSKIPNYR
ncbi:hypothetical protein [Pelosinus sp. sgz500959]|uniref:hypothetical protein n=1 Tax=Pelosinus sp. sgz500959 TaxID=3242472 RepID=UPI0036704885